MRYGEHRWDAGRLAYDSAYEVGELKRCLRCGESKEAVTQFTKNKRKYDGHSDWCRDCTKGRAAELKTGDGRPAFMGHIKEYEGAPLISYRTMTVTRDYDGKVRVKGHYSNAWQTASYTAKCECERYANSVKDVRRHLVNEPRRGLAHGCGIYSYNSIPWLAQQTRGSWDEGRGGSVSVITVNVNYGIVNIHSQGYRSESVDIIQMILIRPEEDNRHIIQTSAGLRYAAHAGDTGVKEFKAEDIAAELQETYGVPVALMTAKEAGLLPEDN